jgi:transposase
VYKATFSEDFQKSAVSKFLNRGNSSGKSIADNLDVSLSTLYGWVKKYGSVHAMKNSKSKKPDDRTPEEKIELVIKFFSLNEEQKGIFLRENGLYSHHLAEWRKNIKNSFVEPKVSQQSFQDKKKIKELEKELRRKDRALAEAAALLVLKKKVDSIWGVDDE